MSTDLLKTIARVRRAMPRNADVMEICDALELATQTAFIVSDRRQLEELKNLPDPLPGKLERFDKSAYMRDYMRKKRSEAKKA